MKTILVVDDEFAVALMLEAALEDEGYRVFVAANGRQALERVAENKPDLVISDLMMPLMNGAEMGRALRADPVNRDIPIIMMSGLPETSVRERFDDYSAFLRKPCLESEVLQLVADILGSAGGR